jgi:NAD+ diphosphatase
MTSVSAPLAKLAEVTAPAVPPADLDDLDLALLRALADAGFLASCEADERAGSYAIGGELVVLKKSAGGHDPLFSPVEARRLGGAAERVFLGLCDGAARFAVGLDPKDIEPLKARDDLLILDLRSIAMRGLVDADHLPPLAEGKALLHWHARHRFCAQCGSPTRVTAAGWVRY